MKILHKIIEAQLENVNERTVNDKYYEEDYKMEPLGQPNNAFKYKFGENNKVILFWEKATEDDFSLIFKYGKVQNGKLVMDSESIHEPTSREAYSSLLAYYNDPDGSWTPINIDDYEIVG